MGRPAGWKACAAPGTRRLPAFRPNCKLCATFESPPKAGSIGRAPELGIGNGAPLVVASSRIGRYQAFGTLFAVLSGAKVRLDRHPTMPVHPVTPMDEANLRLHPARRTGLPVGLVDLPALGAGQGGAGGGGGGTLAPAERAARGMRRVGVMAPAGTRKARRQKRFPLSVQAAPAVSTFSAPASASDGTRHPRGRRRSGTRRKGGLSPIRRCRSGLRQPT